MGDGGGDRPPMRPGVVGEGHGTCGAGVVLKTTGRLHSYADAVSRVGDVRRPNFDVCRRPNSDENRRPDLDENRRPESGEICRPDHADFLQAAPVDVAHPISTDGVAGTDAPQDRRAVLLRASTMAWVAKPDDDLRPISPLEEEALAA